MKKASKEFDLSIEIGFLEGLRARMPEDTETLKLLGDAYTKVGRWEEGLQVDEELARLLPNDPVVQYNLACSLSLVQKVPESAAALLSAIESGYSEWEWLLHDADLENLRKSPEFGPILELIDKRSRK
jgi:predicted Zn-dependent protease